MGGPGPLGPPPWTRACVLLYIYMSSTCKYIGQMGSKSRTRWADNGKWCKMRKLISIRVNSRIPVDIIIIINYNNQSNSKINTQNSHVSQFFTSLKSCFVWGMTRRDVCNDVTQSISTNHNTATEIFCVEIRQT